MTSTSLPTFAGAILAGGRASRFAGTAKGLITLPNGQTIIQRLLDEMRTAGIEPIVLSANVAEPYRHLGLTILPDDRPGKGPLGGVATVLRHYRQKCQAVVFLPCDLPGMTAGTIGSLCQTFITASGRPIVAARADDGTWHPLCAVVACDQLPTIDRALEAGDLRIRDVWQRCGLAPAALTDPRVCFNVNTPDDLARWQRFRKQSFFRS